MIRHVLAVGQLLLGTISIGAMHEPDILAPVVRGPARIVLSGRRTTGPSANGPRRTVGKCDAASYRGFDFWIGSWNASRTGANNAGGTNIITSETDGCTIEEHWTDALGMRGRSLNAFDATTGKWTQLWMDQSGGALLFEGRSADRSMILAGAHVTSRTDSTPLTDRATWTAIGKDSVRQFGELSKAGGPFAMSYDITYRRAQPVRDITVSAVEFCSSPSRPRFHAFDFLIGTWLVHSPDAGSPTLSVVSVDLGGCLLEERITGPDGYKAVAYSGFRSATFEWNRLFMDNRGVQLRLSGPATLTGTSMVLTGRRVDGRGAVTDVRVEWVSVGATTVEQRWSTSSDGAATWTTPTVVAMTKQ